MRTVIKLFTLAAVLLGTQQAQAFFDLGFLSGCGPLEGLYVGGSVGVATPTVAFKSATQVFFQNINSELVRLAPVVREDVCQTRVWGDVSVGWGMTFCKLAYLGGRFGVNFSSSDITSRFTLDNDNREVLYQDTLIEKSRARLWDVEYTFDFRPGLVWCCNTMVFGLIGVAINEVSFNHQTDFIYIDDEPTNALTRVRDSDSRNVAAFRGGLGLEQMVTPCLSVLASYTYTYYGSVNTRRIATVFDSENAASFTDNGLQPSAGARLSRQTASMGVNYHF